MDIHKIKFDVKIEKLGSSQCDKVNLKFEKGTGIEKIENWKNWKLKIEKIENWKN